MQTRQAQSDSKGFCSLISFHPLSVFLPSALQRNYPISFYGNSLIELKWNGYQLFYLSVVERNSLPSFSTLIEWISEKLSSPLFEWKETQYYGNHREAISNILPLNRIAWNKLELFAINGKLFRQICSLIGEEFLLRLRREITISYFKRLWAATSIEEKKNAFSCTPPPFF